MMTLQQTGSKVTGQMQTNTPRIPGGEVQGIVAGNAFMFNTPSGDVSRFELIVKEGEMSGTFQWFGAPSTVTLRRKR